MDKNTVFGLLLMFGLLLGYNWYYAPTEEQLAAMKAAQKEAAEEAQNSDDNDTTEFIEDQDNIEVLVNDSVVASQRLLELTEQYGIFASAIDGEDEVFELGNDNVKIEFSTRGALPLSATLTDGNVRYGDGEAIELWDIDKSNMAVKFDVPGLGRLSTSELHFNLDYQNANQLIFKAQAGTSGFVTISHNLKDYRLKTDISFENLNRSVSEDMIFDWEAAGLRNEKGLQWERQHTSIFFKEQDRGRDYLSEGRSDSETSEYTLEWMAFKQDFFSALVSTEGGFSVGSKLENVLVEDDTLNTLLFSAELPFEARVTGNRVEKSLDFYFGPNKLEELNNTGLNEVGRIIDYGWWIFGWVNRNAILPLYDFLHSQIASAGLIILIITLVIKTLLFPITWKNFMSSAKMRVLRPDIEKINEQHKDDAMARQQATMQLYRNTGVNPMAGCLPALLQMPILYAMFRFFPANIDLRGQGLFWADDLAAYDSILDLPFEIPLYGSHVSGFTVLMAASMFVYMRMTTAGGPAQPQQPGMPNMKVIQNIMPFTMLFFFNKFASGLSVYYLIANLTSIAQMLIIKRFFIDEEKIKAKIAHNMSNPKKKSSFQQRLEEMQKEQQQRTKEIKSQRNRRKK